MDRLLKRILVDSPMLPIESKASLPPCAACYLVIANNEVIYVGQTTNLYRRWLSHHRYKELQLLSNVQICWLQVSDPSVLPQMEKSLIDHFEPGMHRRHLGETKRLTINISISLHRAFKEKTAGEGVLMAEKVTQLIQQYLQNC